MAVGGPVGFQMNFSKYHALGNDYIVIEPSQLANGLTPGQIRRICHRNFGVGSDGILLGPLPSDHADFGLRIFNPDGSEAEKSGNGLRIFCRHLWDNRQVGTDSFTIETVGGIVRAQVHEGGESVTVEMGRISFDSSLIPLAGPVREVLNETISVDGRDYRYCAATIGNPHCIILDAEVSEEVARVVGPVVENDARFPNRTNVQFLSVLDRHNIQIEIWERGAGYTLASGSSSCAAAAVARRLGLCERDITVHMPGGRISVSVSDDFAVTMTGPVTAVFDGCILEQILED